MILAVGPLTAFPPMSGETASTGASKRAFVEYIAKSLVDAPESVVVTEELDGDFIKLHLQVAENDVGKVIGRGGRIAETRGAHVLGDPGFDLNAALRVAIDFLSRYREAGMIVVPSDIPLLPASLIGELVNRVARPPAVALVPATRDGGTNLLACSPVDAISPGFGPDSFQRHGVAARGAVMR